MCISRATVSAVSCLVVPAFICIDLLISLVLKINDDDDDDDDDENSRSQTAMESVWSVSKLSTESDGSRCELVANSVHTADATQLDS